MGSAEFIEKLETRHASHIERVKLVVAGLTDEDLSLEPEPGVWGVGRILGHLNIVTGAYLPVMGAAVSRALADSGGVPKQTLVGKIETKAAGPDWNVPTFKVMTAPAKCTTLVVAEWMENAERLSRVLQQAKGRELSSNKFRNPFVPLLPLNLTDGFMILVEHDERHIRQMEERLPKIKAGATSPSD